MLTNTELRELQAAIAALPRGPNRRLPTGLRQRITAYVHEQVDGGRSRGVISEELGISIPTVRRLLNEKRPAKMVPVRVTPAAASSITVRGPSGLVIEGLGMEGLVALIRALS